MTRSADIAPVVCFGFCVVALALGLYLLPGVKESAIFDRRGLDGPLSDELGRVGKGPEADRGVTLHQASDCDFRWLVDAGSPVAAGDTLAWCVGDRFAAARARLAEAARRGVLPEGDLELPADFASLLHRLRAGSEQRTARANPAALSVADRELIEAELMGAEDAADYFAARGDRDRAVAKRAEARQLRALLRRSEARASRPNPLSPEEIGERLGAMARGLPLDSTAMVSPADGRLDLLGDDWVVRVSAPSSEGAQTASPVTLEAYSRAAYVLRSRGTPVLLATARRVDAAEARRGDVAVLPEGR